MQSPQGPWLSRGVIALVGTLAAIYLVSQFLRNSVGVIAPDLAREMGLSAGEIGLLSSAFFFSFAAAQVPLGIAIDRYGPKRCMLICAAIAFLGTFVFAIATTTAGLISARILMGLGSSCYLMAPLAFASATIGWRATFFCVAGLVVLCGALIAFVVRADAAEHAPAAHAETLRENFAGIAEVVRMRGFWPLFLMNAVTYSSYAIIVGLWGGPYLAHVYGYGLTARGDLLMLPALSQIVGVVAWGYAQRVMGSYQPLILTGALATAAALGLLAAIGKPEPWMLAVWLAVFGFLPAYLPVLIAHGRSLLPPHLVGRGMTLFNIGSMGGTFVVQLASGALIDVSTPIAGAYPLDAYRVVFAAQAVAVLAVCGIYAMMRPKTSSSGP